MVLKWVMHSITEGGGYGLKVDIRVTHEIDGVDLEMQGGHCTDLWIGDVYRSDHGNITFPELDYVSSYTGDVTSSIPVSKCSDPLFYLGDGQTFGSPGKVQVCAHLIRIYTLYAIIKR